jgi:hypothetical protein
MKAESEKSLRGGVDVLSVREPKTLPKAETTSSLGLSCSELARYFDSRVVPKAQKLDLMDGMSYVDFIEKIAGTHHVGPEDEKFTFLRSIVFGIRPDADLHAHVKARFTLDALCVGVLRPIVGAAPLVNRDAVLRLEGFLDALIETKAVTETVSTRNARAAASERHRENRDMKRLAFTWLSAHRAKYRSMDAAAEAIAGKVVPISVRTARGWVSDWHKEQT